MVTARSRLVWQSVSVLATAALMAVLRLIEPLFWLHQDKRNQYVPVAMDIGRRLRSGEFPTIDPSLGTGGNFSLDLQYGLYEPTHWLVAVLLSTFDDLALAGFVWALLYLVVFAWGTTALTLRLDASGPWAALAGVAAATSGFVLFWLGPIWIPGLASIAWLPWLWWSWCGAPTPRRCVATAIFAYLVIAGGWPATWIIFVALALGFVAETALRRDRSLGVRDWAVPLLLRVAATLAGMIPAILTVLPLFRATNYTVRSSSVGNNNFLVGNLADMFGFASPQLRGDLLTFGSQTSASIPIYFAGWFALPVLWLLPWRASLARIPGVVTGFVATIAMLLATQAPSTLGPLRDPIRSLAGVQFFFVVTVTVLACSSRLTYTRHRGWGIAVSLASLAWLTWAREPGVAGLLAVGSAAIGVVVVAGLIARRQVVIAGLAALAGTLLLAALAFGLSPLKAIEANAPSTLSPGKLTLGAAARPILAVYPKAPLPQQELWFRDGVGQAFQRLSADTRMAPGYSSVRQRYYSKRFCVLVAQGQTCRSAVARLFQPEPQTGVPWIDLLGYRTVVVNGLREKVDFSKHAGSDWRKVAKGEKFAEFQRTSPPAVAGRVTHVVGKATIRAVSLSNESQSYDVSTSGGATLIFRDLYWPGYSATLDDTSVRVQPFDNTLVSVQLPPGSSGRLSLTYRPMSRAAIAGLPAAGVMLLGLTMLASHRGSRRPAVEPDASGRVDGHHDHHEPDGGQSLEHPV